jgi:hypothetical protein
MWDLQFLREVTGCRTPGDHASRRCDQRIARGGTATRSAADDRQPAGAAGAKSLQRNPKERDMQRLIMTAAAAALLSGAVMATTSAKAEYNYGPLKNGTQCYKMSANGWNNQGYGYWASCPSPAATANPSRTVRHHDTHHQSKQS